MIGTRERKSKKGVVSLLRNTLVSLNPEWVVTLNRNQVVTFSGISNHATYAAELIVNKCQADG